MCAGNRRARASTRSSDDAAHARGTEVILHLREGEDELLDRAAPAAHSCASTPTTSPLPVQMRREDGFRRRSGATTRRSIAPSAFWRRPEAGDQRRRSTRSSTSTSRTTSKLRSLATHHRVEGALEYTAAALHSGARAVRPVRSRPAPRRQALRAARVHHGRRRAAACRRYLRFVRGVDRLERPSAQRLARDAAGQSGRREPARRCTSSACWRCSTRAARTGSREALPDILGSIRRAC